MTPTFAPLPEGRHSDLHIVRDIRTHTGPYIEHGGWKFIVHITVAPWNALPQMITVLRNKHAEPQVIIGGVPGSKLPTLTQLLDLGEYGRSLEHPAGTPETNRARCVQLEICANPGRDAALRAGARLSDLGEPGDSMDLFPIPDWHQTGRVTLAHEIEDDEFPLCMETTTDQVTRRVFHDGVASWTDETYKALGNVLGLITHGEHPRVPIQLKLCPGAFKIGRRTGGQFVQDAGIAGHMDVPNQPSGHGDPTTDFKGRLLVKYAKSAPNNLEV